MGMARRGGRARQSTGSTRWVNTPSDDVLTTQVDEALRCTPTGCDEAAQRARRAHQDRRHRGPPTEGPGHRGAGRGGAVAQGTALHGTCE
jgi:hypothetical protein